MPAETVPAGGTAGREENRRISNKECPMKKSGGDGAGRRKGWEEENRRISNKECPMKKSDFLF